GNWNPTEAERCYREALRLDPDDVIPRIDLAILLEHNARGQRYSKGARLEEAINLYREILKTSPNFAVQQNLVIALLFPARYEEAKHELKNWPSGEAQAALSTVVTALTESAARAIIETQTSFGDDRTRALNLVNAEVSLVQLRQYDRAHELMKAATRMASSRELQARVEMLGKLKRYEDVLSPPTDPR